ncbi:Fanconi anemia group A protein homolog isoform X2 [Dermacentor albipictus]|uniref:Fanconi anemia group A protein homolog isoform X2 n=1 Tax=Dermacentor albipictus TaxID=60249 RepID=UPI0031FD2D97
MDMETHPDFVDELDALISSTGGFRDIVRELGDTSVILKSDAKELDYVHANDLLVMQAALLSCTNRHDDVSLTEDSFSNLGYAQIVIHCAESVDEESGQNCLLSSQGRKAALTLVAHISAAYASKGIAINFAKVLASCTVAPLELLCRLHAGGVMCIKDYISLNVQNPQVIADLSRSLFGLCQLLDQSEPSAFTFSVFMCELVSSAYSASDHNDASASVRKVCQTILGTLLQRLLKANEEGQPITCGDLLGPLLQSPLVQQTAVLSYAQELLSCILAYNPVYKVTQAMSSHHNWTYKKCSLWLLGIFQKSMQVLNVEQVTTQLCKALNSKEVNWYMLLTALSVYVTTYQDCKLLIGLIETLLKGAFECLDAENLVSAFLLARHASQEAPQIFPPYSSWFEKYFGFSDTTYASSSRTFAFLVKFLSEMVPFEQPKYLKAHLQKPAHASPKCRVIYHDYVALAKTRLQDFEIADERNAFSEDAEQLAQAHGFVRKSIEDFAAKGKIPRAVIEASIFKKPYFTGQFLPVLLNPKNFPEHRGVVCSMVQGLLQHGKISQERYDRFVDDCNRKETDDTCDAEMNRPVPLPEHLLAQLRSGSLPNKDCEVVVLRIIEEVKKNELEVLENALNLEQELPYSKEMFELLHFAEEACCHQPPHPWIKCLLLALGSSLSTVHLLAAFLWRQVTTIQVKDRQGAEILSQFLLSVPVMWEDKPLKISVSGATYMSVQEAVFLWLPLSTLQERRQFLQLSAMYLIAAARQAPCTTVPPYVPEVLLKKFEFVMQRNECTLGEIDSDAWKQCSESPVKDWLQPGKLSLQEWVNYESEISDGVNATITPVMRQDLLRFIADVDSVRCLCATLLRVLVCRGPRLPNHAQLHILLQSLLLNSSSSFSGKAVPFATEALTQIETEVAGCPLDVVERAINFFRIYCHLPPYCLLVNRTDDCPTSESVKLFITVINNNLLHILCSQQDMPMLTLHLFKGLLQSNLSRADASTILEQCPVLVLCLIRHWNTICPVLALEPVKCEELGNLLTTVEKLFAMVAEFLAGSEEPGKKLSKISKTWLPAFVLACSISSDQVMPLHYKSLKPMVQTMVLQFLLMFCQKNDSKPKDGLKILLSRFLQENPSLCTSLEPASFDSALMNTLMSALDFFMLLVYCFNFIVNCVEQQKVKKSCCINTAILLMVHIDAIDGDILSDDRAPAELQAEGVCTPISTSAKLYSLIRNAPPALLKSLPKATLAMCPTVFRQCIEHL